MGIGLEIGAKLAGELTKLGVEPRTLADLSKIEVGNRLRIDQGDLFGILAFSLLGIAGGALKTWWDATKLGKENSANRYVINGTKGAAIGLAAGLAISAST